WDRKSLLAQEIRIEQLRLIARTEIRKNRNDGVAWPHLLGEPDGAGDVDAGRAAHAQPFVLEQVENHRYRLLVANLIGDIDRGIFQVLGNAALANAFGDGG